MKQFLKDILPAAFLFASFWQCNRICTAMPELWQAKILHPFGLYVFMCIFATFSFYAIPYAKVSFKMIALFVLFTSIFATLLYAGVQLHLVTKYTWEEMSAQYRDNPDIAIERMLPGAKKILDCYQPILFSGFVYMQYKFRKLDIKKSDRINNRNIMIVFVYPENWVGISLLMFWKVPVTTIKLYYKGVLYGFKKSIGELIKEEVTPEDLQGRFIRDTHLNTSVENILFGLVGVKWSFKRNCLNVFEPVIGKITNYI